jgi:small subunit ribosomal protein S9
LQRLYIEKSLGYRRDVALRRLYIEKRLGYRRDVALQRLYIEKSLGYRRDVALQRLYIEKSLGYRRDVALQRLYNNKYINEQDYNMSDTTTAIKQKETDTKEVPAFKGKYISATGRRKRAVAEVRLYDKGKGVIMVNGLKAQDYFQAVYMLIIGQPLKLTGHIRDLNFSVIVHGGGKRGQADAVRHGISRTLLKMNEELRPVLKTKNYLTRDARKVERKKPGLKKARRAPQWSKR